MNTKEFSTINGIVDEIIQEVKSVQDPFAGPIIACNNIKITEYFKSQYLKKEAGVLMNASFNSFTALVEEMLGVSKGSSEKLLSRTDLELFIIKTLTRKDKFTYDKTNPANPINYIYKYEGEKYDGVNLREFAHRLSILFTNYELDCFDLGAAAGAPGASDMIKLEKEIYDAATKSAEGYGYYTLKGLYEKKKSKVKFKKKVLVIDNSYISELYKEIFKLADDITVYTFEEEPELHEVTKVVSAPSKLREVEALHTEICQIFDKNSSKYDKNAKYNDILVYAPDINEYANTIRRVFMQDGKEFPEIPFHIVGEVREKKDLHSALAILFDIASKEFMTRKHFHDIISNPMFKRLHDISDEDVEIFDEVIVKTNTHRDWLYLRGRLVASALVGDSASLDNVARIGERDFVPYSNIGLDAKKMGKLIEIIDSLLAWKELVSNCCDDSLDMSFFIETLDRLFSDKSVDGVEKNYVYKELKDYLLQIEELSMMIPLDTLLLNLQDISDSYKLYPTGMFMSGVTFLSLNVDDVLSGKYVFVMGMSSDAYPRADQASELDVSDKHISNLELDTMAIRNLMRNNENVIVSFIDTDLKTDEEKYLSHLVACDKKMIEKIPLDESRDYGALYTLREMRAKEDYYGLGSSSPISSSGGAYTPAKKETLKISEIKKFLINTMQYKYESQFKKDKDDYSKDVYDEYEEIDISPLDRSSIAKNIITVEVEHKGRSKEELIYKNILPSADYREKIYDAISDDVSQVVIDEINTGYKKIEISPIIFGGASPWTLESGDSIYRKEDGLDVSYVYVAKKPEKKDKDYLYPYLISLMDIASRHEDKEYNVTLWEGKKYKVTPAQAREIFEKFYEIMRDTANIKYMDIELLGKELKEEDFDTISRLKNKITNNEGWKYFDGKNMIEPERDFGYSEDSFYDELCDYKNKIKKLVLFYAEEKEAEDSETEEGGADDGNN